MGTVLSINYGVLTRNVFTGLEMNKTTGVCSSSFSKIGRSTDHSRDRTYRSLLVREGPCTISNKRFNACVPLKLCLY